MTSASAIAGFVQPSATSAATSRSRAVRAPAFARPARGRDRFTIRDGRIARLESTLVAAPEPRHEG